MPQAVFRRPHIRRQPRQVPFGVAAAAPAGSDFLAEHVRRVALRPRELPPSYRGRRTVFLQRALPTASAPASSAVLDVVRRAALRRRPLPDLARGFRPSALPQGVAATPGIGDYIAAHVRRVVSRDRAILPVLGRRGFRPPHPPILGVAAGGGDIAWLMAHVRRVSRLSHTRRSWHVIGTGVGFWPLQGPQGSYSPKGGSAVAVIVPIGGPTTPSRWPAGNVVQSGAEAGVVVQSGPTAGNVVQSGPEAGKVVQ